MVRLRPYVSLVLGEGDYDNGEVAVATIPSAENE